jgi:hypothetical protein
LRASADDLLSFTIVDIADISLLLLGPLPDLDFTSSSNDTNSYCREKVVSGVGVIVDSSIEHGRGIFAESRLDHCFSTRMIADEVSNVMNDPSNSNKSSAVLGLVLVVVPFHDWKLLERNTPVEFRSFLVEFLLLLLNTALFDFVGLELFEIKSKAHLLPQPDGPFGGIILMPLDSIAVVGWELVVEVVVSLAESDQGSDDVIPRRVSVVKWLISKPVSKGIDAEGGLLDEEDSKDASIHKSTKPVTPAEASDQAREDETHEEDHLEVMTMLPCDDCISVQVGDISAANSLWVLLHDHPAKVGIQETFTDRVWIFVCVGVSVMSSVVSSPPSDGTLDSSTSHSRQEDLQRNGGRV